MSEKPERPWFRFHLLTAVVMMIVTAGQVGFDVWFFKNAIVSEFIRIVSVIVILHIVVLFYVWVACESFIRRREARKT
jgi:hypothetical protein